MILWCFSCFDSISFHLFVVGSSLFITHTGSGPDHTARIARRARPVYFRKWWSGSHSRRLLHCGCAGLASSYGSICIYDSDYWLRTPSRCHPISTSGTEPPQQEGPRSAAAAATTASPAAAAAETATTAAAQTAAKAETGTSRQLTGTRWCW